MGDLSFQGEPTAVLYGVFRDILQLQELYATSYIAFCFDGGCDRRTRIFPRYKRSRVDANKERSEEEREARRSLRNQIYNLRVKHLPEAGFCNLFYQDGYEADDLIAALVKQYTEHESIILSSDKDLYQLLRPGVWIWNPVSQKSITVESFQEEWGISPDRWAWVKAIAGCKTDNISGIPGVREKTAVKYLIGKTSENQTQKIGTLQYDMLAKNLPLVTIPLPGLAPMELRPDEVTAKKWRAFCKWKGMDSLTKLNWKGLLYG